MREHANRICLQSGIIYSVVTYFGPPGPIWSHGFGSGRAFVRPRRAQINEIIKPRARLFLKRTSSVPGGCMDITPSCDQRTILNVMIDDRYRSGTFQRRKARFITYIG
jgi:hypothetical protein